MVAARRTAEPPLTSGGCPGVRLRAHCGGSVRGPGRVLVGPDDSGVDTDIPALHTGVAAPLEYGSSSCHCSSVKL